MALAHRFVRVVHVRGRFRVIRPNGCESTQPTSARCDCDTDTFAIADRDGDSLLDSHAHLHGDVDPRRDVDFHIDAVAESDAE